MSSQSVSLQGNLGLVQYPHSQVFLIESDFFVGNAIVLIAGVHEHLPVINEKLPSTYFHGKKRKFEAVVQGRFKKPISFADVYVGQIFTGPLACAPPDWLLSLLLPIMQAISPGLKMDLTHPDNPYLISPLMSTMQAISINQPGKEPGIFDMFGTTRDDLSVLDKDLFARMEISNRKAYFSNINNLRRFEFDPSLVYSFGFYQHVINMTNRHIEPVPLVSYSLDNILGSRPIQFMAAVLPSELIFESRPPTPVLDSELVNLGLNTEVANSKPTSAPVTATVTATATTATATATATATETSPSRLSWTRTKGGAKEKHKELKWDYIFDVEVCKADSKH